MRFDLKKKHNLIFTINCIFKVKCKLKNKRVLDYFPKFDTFFAHDPEKKCKVGDVVLIKELPQKLTKRITHSLSKIVHPFGDITDPFTGEKVVVGNFRSHIKKRNELYGMGEDSEGAECFNYADAPPRGWQEGKKDFTHKRGYQKWHEFEPGHYLHNDPTAS
ncbi:unnamed protein product, partial [Meganyctiphanes norvegica]